MERAEERNNLLASSVIARHFQRALNRLSPGIAVEELMRPRHRRHSRQPLGKIRQMLVVEIRARNMNQLRRLLLDRSHDFGMAMTRRNHRNPRSEVEELVSIRIFQPNSPPALGHQRIRARIARRDQPMIGFNNSPRLRSRQRTNQFWSKLRIHLFLICRLLTHGTFSSAGSVAAAWQQTRSFTCSEFFVSDAARPRIPSKGSLIFHVSYFISVDPLRAILGEDLRRRATNRRRRG